MFSKLFLALVAASCVVSTPVAQHPRMRNGVRTSMPIKVHFDASSVKNFAEQERERARFMASKHTKRQTDVPVANAIVTYTAEVGVGNPPTMFNLVVDTGSSNTWVGANMTRPYVMTSTSNATNQNVGVTYGSGQFQGSEFIDQVTLGPGLVIKNQSIGVADFAQGFDGVDGILGVGPADLTVGTLSQTPNTVIPTVVDSLFQQGTITTSELGVLFEPTNSTDFLLTGTLTFGGIDEDQLTSRVNYVPITQTSPSSRFWGIDQSITYGNQSMPILRETAGIVDTGTTLVLLATDAIEAYQNATGAILDQNTGLLSITKAQMNRLQSLSFHIGNATYELTAEAQTFPSFLNSQIGGDPDAIYLVVADAGTPTGSGLDFINGFSFLQRFYSVYDTENSRVGFATTNFTKGLGNLNNTDDSY